MLNFFLIPEIVSLLCKKSFGDLQPFNIFLLLTFALMVSCKSRTEGRVIQSLEDEIGAENFTYFKLHRTGALRLELKSLVGDVDIYISFEVQHPDYSTYDLKSETCGLDVIHIPSSMPRPVYIALFGHPNYLVSRYRLSTFEVIESTKDDYEALVEKYERYYFDGIDGLSDEGGENSQPKEESNTSGNKVEDELPLWWKLLLSFLEFGIEVIL